MPKVDMYVLKDGIFNYIYICIYYVKKYVLYN